MSKKTLRKTITALLAAILIVALVGCSGSKDAGQVNLMTWGGDFIPREIIDEFEKETGIKVNYKEET